MIAAYETWLATGGQDGQRQLAALRLLGLFDRPASDDCLAALRRAPAIDGLTEALVDLDSEDWNLTVSALESAGLVQPDGASLDAHPLIREYFAVQLRAQHAKAFRAAHGRLFDHLCASTKPHHPEGLDGLQPLYQAVVHGCLAGRHPEARAKVYRDRILRGTGNDGNYSTKKLGAIGADLSAVAAFFDQPWSRLSPNLSEADQAWLLAVAAFNLRALGRLTEALEPMRVSVDMAIKAKDWKEAAIRASNLSELEVTLGRLESAVADARRGIDFADRSGDENWPAFSRCKAADALHQSGAADEARGLFADAERMQQARQPQFDLLYSLRGFLYCDLLLAPAERAAWRVLSGVSFQLAVPTTDEAGTADLSHPDGASGVAGVERSEPPVRTNRGLAPLDPGHPPHGSAHEQMASWKLTPRALSDAERTAAPQACTEVERRASTIFQWRAGTVWNPNADTVLDIALDNLTLSRATLYAWLLRADSSSLVDPSAFSLPPALSDAVNGFRKSGQVDWLPRGLLTSSVCHVLAGELELAVAELNEALQIARRGPMPLYHADILLTRARLFAVGPVPTGRVGEGNAAGGNRPYPWDTTPQADLAEARRLIKHHGYLRRMPELEDAEQALGSVIPPTQALE